jgi:PAS domain S-box-containing protein
MPIFDFEKLFDNLDQPTTVAEPNSPNVLLYANKAFCALVGYSQAELVGKNPGELLQRPPYTKIREHIRSKLNSYDKIDILVQNYRKDGSMFWNGLHIHPVMDDDDNTCIYWIGRTNVVTNFVQETTTILDKLSIDLKNQFIKMKKDLLVT